VRLKIRAVLSNAGREIDMAEIGILLIILVALWGIAGANIQGQR
jgi:hypothetical protein